MTTRVILGCSGLSVSPICYGSWQLSPRFWGPQPEDELTVAMQRAFEVGINFYDTADAYGDGLSETVMGNALKNLPRDEIVLATKLYSFSPAGGKRTPNLSKENVIASCDASLKRLQMDYIDLYQCHFYDQLTPIEETVAALEGLKAQGKIRAYGASNYTVEQLRLARKAGNFSTLQPLYNLLKREIEADLLPLCHAEDIGVLVYSPLQNGLLTGKYTGTETFTDFRARRAEFQGDRFQKLAAQIAGLAKLAEKYQLTITQLVLAATLMHPAVDVAIVGIKNTQQIEEAAGAMGKTICREDYYTIRESIV